VAPIETGKHYRLALPALPDMAINPKDYFQQATLKPSILMPDAVVALIHRWCTTNRNGASNGGW